MSCLGPNRCLRSVLLVQFVLALLPVHIAANSSPCMQVIMELPETCGMDDSAGDSGMAVMCGGPCVELVKRMENICKEESHRLRGDVRLIEVTLARVMTKVGDVVRPQSEHETPLGGVAKVFQFVSDVCSPCGQALMLANPGTTCGGASGPFAAESTNLECRHTFCAIESTCPMNANSPFPGMPQEIYNDILTQISRNVGCHDAAAPTTSQTNAMNLVII